MYTGYNMLGIFHCIIWCVLHGVRRDFTCVLFLLLFIMILLTLYALELCIGGLPYRAAFFRFKKNIFYLYVFMPWSSAMLTCLDEQHFKCLENYILPLFFLRLGARQVLTCSTESFFYKEFIKIMFYLYFFTPWSSASFDLLDGKFFFFFKSL